MKKNNKEENNLTLLLDVSFVSEEETYTIGITNPRIFDPLFTTATVPFPPTSTP